MTYILNAIPLGSREMVPLQAGRLHAEIDEPATAVLRVGGQHLVGTHYLIVTDDGTGYTSSNELVLVPHHSEQPTIIDVPEALVDDFRQLLQELIQQSPERRLAVYLEANRAISREDPDDPFPTQPTIVEHTSFDEFWQGIRQRSVEEEEIRIIG